MSNLKLPTDEYLQTIANPQLEVAKCYYQNGQLRIEVTPQGYEHSVHL